MQNQRKNAGFIGKIVLILVALALLKYFLNWDVFDAASSDQGKSTILYVRDIINVVWSYISFPVTFTWDKIVWPIISLSWDNFNRFIEWGRSI